MLGFDDEWRARAELPADLRRVAWPATSPSGTSSSRTSSCPTAASCATGSAATRSTPRSAHARSPTTCSRSSGSGAASPPSSGTRSRTAGYGDGLIPSEHPAVRLRVDWGVEGGERFTFEPGSGTYCRRRRHRTSFRRRWRTGSRPCTSRRSRSTRWRRWSRWARPRARIVTVDPHYQHLDARLGIRAPAGRRVPAQPRRGGGDPRRLAGGPRGGARAGRARRAARLREARRRGLDRVPRSGRRARRARRGRGRARSTRPAAATPSAAASSSAWPRRTTCAARWPTGRSLPASQRPITARRTRSWSIEPRRTAARPPSLPSSESPIGESRRPLEHLSASMASSPHLSRSPSLWPYRLVVARPLGLGVALAIIVSVGAPASDSKPSRTAAASAACSFTTRLPAPPSDRPNETLHVRVLPGLIAAAGTLTVTFAPAVATNRIVFRLWPNSPF